MLFSPLTFHDTILSFIDQFDFPPFWFALLPLLLNLTSKVINFFNSCIRLPLFFLISTFVFICLACLLPSICISSSRVFFSCPLKTFPNNLLSFMSFYCIHTVIFIFFSSSSSLCSNYSGITSSISQISPLPGVLQLVSYCEFSPLLTFFSSH